MNLYEGIKNNLNEAYEVGNINSKLLQGVKSFDSMLQGIRDKYITKDVITAAHKIQKAVEEGKIPNDSVHNPLYGSQSNVDGIVPAIIKVPYSEAFIDDKVFLYSPLTFGSDHGDADLGYYSEFTSPTIGDEWINVYGAPVGDDGLIDLSPIGFESQLDNLPDSGPQRDDFINRTLEVLNNKHGIAKIYKDVCKTLAKDILAKSNAMGEARKQDIADKQRFVANAINDSEDSDFRTGYKELYGEDASYTDIRKIIEELRAVNEQAIEDGFNFSDRFTKVINDLSSICEDIEDFYEHK